MTILGDFRDEARGVWVLALPAIAQQLLHTLTFLVDRGMLGHYAADSLASMQISGPVMWSVFSVLAAFGAGTVATVGRYVGEGNKDAATETMRASLYFAVGLGTLAALASIPLLPLLLPLFDDAGTPVLLEAKAYLGVELLALPVHLAAYMMAVSLQAAGDTRTPFLVSIGANLINVGLNYALIFGHFGLDPMGARGAAWGSALAMGVELVVLLGLTTRRDASLCIRRSATVKRPAKSVLRPLLRISGPAFLERVVQHAGFLGFVGIIAMLGSVAMAANQAMVSIESICFMSADGFGIAAGALVAQNLGAKKPSAAQAAGWFAALYAAIALGTVSLVFVIVPEQLLSLFSSDPEIVAAGLSCLLYAAIAEPFMGVSIVLSAALRGAGDTRSPFWVTTVCGFGVRLSATYLFAIEWQLGLVGIWLGSGLDWVLRSGGVVYFFSRGRFVQRLHLDELA